MRGKKNAIVAEISDIQEISRPYPSLLLKLKVLNLSCPQNQTNKLIPSKEGIESSLTIYRGRQKLKIGEIIEGIIYFGGDERFHDISSRITGIFLKIKRV